MTEPSRTRTSRDWVRKRDGRLVPFEAAKISQALFAASETLGSPDAFMARELTDGVLHFLTLDSDGSSFDTGRVAELVVKIVRESGHPGLAKAFVEGRAAKLKSALPSEFPTRDASLATPVVTLPPSACWARHAGAEESRRYTLCEVFSRDLHAAHDEELLTLGGLESPLELAGLLLGPPTDAHYVEAIELARGTAGSFLAIDGPETFLSTPHDAKAFVRELGIGVRATGLQAVVNLNSKSPPTWTTDLAQGPLFSANRPQKAGDDSLVHVVLEQLLEHVHSPNQLRIDWHVNELDFSVEASGQGGMLTNLARRALGGAPLAFVFDRPQLPIALAEGIDRLHRATLMTVGLHLPRLARQMGRNGATSHLDPDTFLKKLGSLARLALSAAVRKRDFMRRHHRDWPAFLVDRARLVVAPVGLEDVVESFHGESTTEGGAGLGLARQIVQRLEEVLTLDGRAFLLDTCLDTTLDARLAPFQTRCANLPNVSSCWLTRPQVAGATPWDRTATLASQFMAAGQLQGDRSSGTVALSLADAELPKAEDLVALLYWAWKNTGIVRVRFVSAASTTRQLLAPWESRPG